MQASAAHRSATVLWLLFGAGLQLLMRQRISSADLCCQAAAVPVRDHRTKGSPGIDGQLPRLPGGCPDGLLAPAP